MKKLLLFFLCLLFAVPATAATPVILHAITAPTVDSAGNITDYIMRYPQPMGVGNDGMIVINGATGNTITCTDDKSVAWTAGPTRDDSNQKLSAFYTLDRSDGPQIVTCTYASGSHTFTSGALFETYNTGAFDKSCGDSFNFTEIDCSTAATAVDGELILAVGTQTDTASTLTGWTPGTGYNWAAADSLDSTYAVYQIQSAAGVAQPLINMDASRHGVIVAMTFRPDTSGTAPTGMYPINVYQGRLKSTDNGGTVTFMFPCRGDENSITMIWNGAAGRLITGTTPAVDITSTNTTGTWKQPNPIGTPFGGSGQNQIPYLENGSCTSNTTITPTFSGGQSLDSEFIIISWIGGATTFLDPATPQNTTGTDSTGNPFTGSAITVTNSSWIITYLGSATGGGSESTCSPGTFISPQTIPVILTNPVGENQGACIQSKAAGTTYTTTWTPNSIAVGTWNNYLVAFDASGGSFKPFSLPITGVGVLMFLLFWR